ncbi:methyltransferase domain-containing protein [Candidatus Woesearchaeota archaeon]|nr:methyltransferase domain-containing protein [Candidatus Woesearchaeota archaeon]
MMIEWNKKQLAKNYESGRPLDTKVIIELFNKISEIVSLDNKKILDAGCGTGRISIPLSRRFDSLKITGVDKSKEMIEVLKEKIDEQKIKNYDVIKSDLSKIGFEDNYFDFAIISSVLHSIRDWHEVVKEVMRVIKKEGFLFLISEQGDIFDIGLERKASKGNGLLERFWGRYIELRHKYDLESPEKSQVGLKWELGEPKLIEFLSDMGYSESKSTITINWQKDFSIRESLDIIENRCWSSMFTADNQKFNNLIKDMKRWIEDEKISLQDKYTSSLTINCVVVRLIHPANS